MMILKGLVLYNTEFRDKVVELENGVCFYVHGEGGVCTEKSKRKLEEYGNIEVKCWWIKGKQLHIVEESRGFGNMFRRLLKKFRKEEYKGDYLIIQNYMPDRYGNGYNYYEVLDNKCRSVFQNKSREVCEFWVKGRKKDE